MTPGTGILATPRRVVAVLAAAVLLAGLVLVDASPAAAAEGPCRGDACDDGSWAAARGASNEISYWGMSSGHNCTNYVAWRLIEAGVPKPPTHPGNAGNWAANAIADGYRVDGEPAVGAVAHWNPNVGWGALGHVAYVERLNDDGTILVSEDYWGGGSQVGPLTYRTVDPATVSHFIHYVSDESAWLRTAAATEQGWAATGTHLNVEPTAMTALSRGDGTVDVFYVEGGRLWQASPSPDGWVTTDTGVASTTDSLSAITMYGARPYLMSVEDGELVMTVNGDGSWQRMPTGVRTTGDTAALNLGGLLPTIFVSTYGRLWRVWGDTEGWHAESTGVPVEGPIEAVTDPYGRPVVFSTTAGDLTRSWFDGVGWRSESTGVVATGEVRAVWTATGPEVYFVQDDQVLVARSDGAAWTATPLGLDAGSLFEVADVGTSTPFLALVG